MTVVKRRFGKTITDAVMDKPDYSGNVIPDGEGGNTASAPVGLHGGALDNLCACGCRLSG